MHAATARDKISSGHKSAEGHYPRLSNQKGSLPDIKNANDNFSSRNHSVMGKDDNSLICT